MMKLDHFFLSHSLRIHFLNATTLLMHFYFKDNLLRILLSKMIIEAFSYQFFHFWNSNSCNNFLNFGAYFLIQKNYLALQLQLLSFTMMSSLWEKARNDPPDSMESTLVTKKPSVHPYYSMFQIH